MWWEKEILKALKEIDLEDKDYRFVVILRLKPVEEAEEEEGTGRYKLLRYKKGVKNAGAF